VSGWDFVMSTFADVGGKPSLPTHCTPLATADTDVNYEACGAHGSRGWLTS
jgi:hypothetical protein